MNDADLTLNEKRAILASWASDACALEAAPELRETPAGSRVRFDDILEALRSLDREASTDRSPASRRRLLRKPRIGGLLRSAKPDRGTPLQ